MAQTQAPALAINFHVFQIHEVLLSEVFIFNSKGSDICHAPRLGLNFQREFLQKGKTWTQHAKIPVFKPAANPSFVHGPMLLWLCFQPRFEDHIQAHQKCPQFVPAMLMHLLTRIATSSMYKASSPRNNGRQQVPAANLRNATACVATQPLKPCKQDGFPDVISSDMLKQLCFCLPFQSLGHQTSSTQPPQLPSPKHALPSTTAIKTTKTTSPQLEFWEPAQPGRRLAPETFHFGCFYLFSTCNKLPVRVCSSRASSLERLSHNPLVSAVKTLSRNVRLCLCGRRSATADLLLFLPNACGSGAERLLVVHEVLYWARDVGALYLALL